jgi:micrococcal nuclease
MPALLRPLAAAALALAAAHAAAAPAATAPVYLVERVYDGDSLRVAPADGAEVITVRLSGIDAPEVCQDGGVQARLYLTDLLLGRRVQLEVPKGKAGRDEYGRTLAKVFLDGTEVNRQLVENGHAWSQRYKWDRGPYVAQERMASALRRGLHAAATAPEMPRDFRRRHGPCQ